MVAAAAAAVVAAQQPAAAAAVAPAPVAEPSSRSAATASAVLSAAAVIQNSRASHRHTPQWRVAAYKAIAQVSIRHNDYNATDGPSAARHGASPRQRHFWFRGFRYFVTPLLERAAAGRTAPATARLRLRHRQQSRAARPIRPRVRLRSHRQSASNIGREAGRTRLARASVDCSPVSRRARSTSSRRSTCSIRCPTPIERAAVAEMYRVLRPGGWLIVNVAAMEMLRGDHSVLSHEVRRYSRDSLSAPAHRRRLRRSSASPTPTRSSSRRWRSRAPSSARGASRAKQHADAGDHACRPRRSTSR